MRLIALTGGIATGKSTVAGMLRELGVPVVDSDESARAVVEPGTAGLEEVVREFGESVLGPDGRLDRASLGEIVFADEARRRRLEAILFPLIRAHSAARVGEAAVRGEEWVVLDIPLLFETGRIEGYEAVIVVYAPEEVQLSRLRRRNGLSEEQARARLAAQLPIEAKRRPASHVIDNSGELAATRAQLERVWTAITAAAGSGP